MAYGTRPSIHTCATITVRLVQPGGGQPGSLHVPQQWVMLGDDKRAAPCFSIL